MRPRRTPPCRARSSPTRTHPEPEVTQAPEEPEEPSHLPPTLAAVIHSPFAIGFLGGAGVLAAWWLGSIVTHVAHILFLVVVAMFLAAGLNPLVEALERHRIRRNLAVVVVITLVVATLAMFLLAVVPVLAEQVGLIATTTPDWIRGLQHNDKIQEFDRHYHLLQRIQESVTTGNWAQRLFGGMIGLGLKLLSVMGNIFVVTVLTLYFLATMKPTKEALYRLVPGSRRERVTDLCDRMLQGVGGYVAGAFVVAVAAGLSTLVFLWAAGMGKYAVALALLVALLDVVPMIGATLGAIAASAIGFATDWQTGVACVVFFLVYQQIENYLIYPRVMKKSVDVPGAVTVIAALIGASLLGVVGAVIAVPTAAAILLLIREVWVPKQETR